MANNVWDIIYNDGGSPPTATKVYNSTIMKYSFSLTDSTWNGQDGGGTYYFDPAYKAALSSSSPDEQTAFVAAMQRWENLSIIDFQAVGGGTADLVVYHADTTGNNHPIPSPAASAAGGRANWLDVSGNTFGKAEIALDDDVNLADGSGYSTWLALHEIGHALGLKHPAAGEYDSNYNLLKTVMSYNIPGSDDNGGPGSPFQDYWAITPMAYDIAALVNLKGSYDDNAGNTTYDATWFSAYGVDGTHHYAMTIADTSGTDTIDLSGIGGNHVIDLRQAIDGSDVWQNTPTIIGDDEYVFIARGSVIENATGGSGTNTIIGNSAANTLTGGSGVDDIQGGDGNDTIYGGDGGDDIDGGSGTDTIIYNNSDAGVTVDLSLATAQSGGYADGDILSGIENLNGSTYDDTLTGTSCANIIHGNTGNDTISGAGGNDGIHGGLGVDELTGGSGLDTFLYLLQGDSGTSNGTRDTITDFSQGDGDLIDVGALAGFATNVFIGTGAFTGSGTRSEVRYTNLGGGDTLVGMDIDGAGGADWQIVLSGTYTLVSGDFVLV
jgi:serralysin